MKLIQRKNLKEESVGRRAFFEGSSRHGEARTSRDRRPWQPRDLNLVTSVATWTLGLLKRALGGIAIIGLAHASAGAEANGSASLYAKRDTWSETLIATRQNVSRWQNEQPNQAATRELTVIWQRFSKDFPAQYQSHYLQ